MKTLSLSLTFAVTLSLLFSCKQKPSIEVREIDFVNKAETTVHGVPVNAQMPLSVHGMIHCDSLNIVVAEDPKGYVHVYSDSWQMLDVFSGKGRARNEFLTSPSMNRGQVFKGSDGHILLPLSDWRADVVKLMDITESLEQHRAIINDVREYGFEEETKIIDNTQKTETRLMSSFSALYLDDNIYHTLEITYADFYEILKKPVEYRIRHDSTFMEKPEILSRMEQLVGPEYKNQFSRSAYRHPKRNLIIEPYTNLDYIAFLDLDNNRSFFIHQAGSPTYDSNVEIGKYVEDGVVYASPERVCFTAAIPTDDFFIISYYGPYVDNAPASPEMMFFDWEGNFIKSVKLDILTKYNVFDPKTKTLYGIRMPDDDEEQLISFDLSTVIDW